jgi:hypothetical protein
MPLLPLKQILHNHIPRVLPYESLCPKAIKSDV